jgi:phospholipid transport system substrate-binding protein
MRLKSFHIMAATLVLLLISTEFVIAGPAGEQVKQTVDRVVAIVADPALKGEAKQQERRRKLKEILYARFDFNEMAKRSLGSHWQKRSPEEQKEFVQLFTEVLESAYLDKLESYKGEKVRYLNERQEADFAEVSTKVIDGKGEELSLNYRLHSVNGDWKVTDVVVENISLVNNYRAQFNRVLAKSSYGELVQAMKQKKLSAPGVDS